MPRTTSLPNLTATQREALQAVQSIAERTCIRVDTVPGDFTFVNNLAIVHGREAFEDSGNAARYLVRLWLRSDAHAWALPRALETANWMVFDDDLLQDDYNISPLDVIKFQVYERQTP